MHNTDTMIKKIGGKQIKGLLCINCNRIVKDHSFTELGRCLIETQIKLLRDGARYIKQGDII